MTTQPVRTPAGTGVKAGRGHRARLLLLMLVVVAGGLAAYGIWSRGNTVSALKKTAEDAALPRVQVVSPKPGPAQRTLTLPGTIEAWYLSLIHI